MRMVKIIALVVVAFTLLGDGAELTRRYRQRLTNLIF